MCQIALSRLKWQMKHEGIRLESKKRELGNVAKAIGVPLDELMGFERILINEILEECFGKKRNDDREDEHG